MRRLAVTKIQEYARWHKKNGIQWLLIRTTENQNGKTVCFFHSRMGAEAHLPVGKPQDKVAKRLLIPDAAGIANCRCGEVL